MLLKDIGEKKIIQLIQDTIPVEFNSILAKRDDAFYFQTFQRDLLFNMDMLVGSTDVPNMMEGFHVGRKAIIMNISDLIVKGVKPEAIMISFGLPRELKLNYFKEILKGIKRVIQERDIKYLGGDVNESNDLIIDVTVIGYLEKKVISRSGYGLGDVVAITGQFGFTGAGLHVILEHPELVKEKKYSKFVKSVLEPRLEYKKILHIASQDGIIASIDSSDGLSSSLLDLMEVNGMGFLIDELEIPGCLDSFAKFHGIPVENLVFHGGEEYIGVFIVKKGEWEFMKRFADQNGYWFKKIGNVQQIEKIHFKTKKSEGLKEIRKRGFEHFTARLP